MTNPAIPPAALAAVKDFLTYTIDKPDEAKARNLLSADSLAGGSFAIPPELVGGKYSVGDATVENGQVWVPVTTDASGQQLTIPFAPIQENGEWKLDMTKSMGRMMGGIMGEAVGQMAHAVGEVMQGVGNALGTAFSGATEMAAGAMHSITHAATPRDAPPPDIDPAALDAFRAKVLKPAEDQAKEQLDAAITLDVDFATLLKGQDARQNLRLLDTLKSRVFSNWNYFLRETNEQFPLAGRLKTIRLEGVNDPRERAVFSEGARIVYRLNLAQDAGSYDGQGFGRILTGVVAGMPENAPPSDTVRRGPSYRPTGTGRRMVDDYREFVEPVLQRRIGELLGRDLPIQIDFDSIAEDSDEAAGFWIWGLNRLAGALGLVMREQGNQQALSESLKAVRFLTVSEPAMKSIRLEDQGELWIYCALSRGEEGCYYESEIADAISQNFKLRLRPKVAELEAYMKTWEPQLLEIFGRPIRFAVDFESFTGHPDENRALFALALLKEHGIDALYYAVTSLAETNPNFKQQFPQRVAWLYVESAPQADMKSVDGDQTTIRYRAFLFEGYKGYLTIKELEKLLPAIVAAMPDIVSDETPAPTDGEKTDDATAEDPAAPQKLEALPAEDETEGEDSEPQESDQAGESAETKFSPGISTQDEAFARLQSDMANILGNYAPQLAAMVGKPLPVEIDWQSVDKKMELVGELLNASLSPVLGGLAFLGQDPKARAALAHQIERVVLKKTADPTQHGFSLQNSILTFSAFLSPGMPVMDPQLAATVLRGILHTQLTPTPPAPEKKPTKKSPAKKPLTKKPASRKPPAAKNPKPPAKKKKKK